MVAIQVMQFDPNSDKASSYSLEQIITPDKGVSAEILRISNSAFYGRSGKVKTLRDAITLLGLKTVKNLVILLSTQSISGSLKGEMLVKYLQEFPIVAALVAQELCQKLGHKEFKDEIFVGGLLHKIGMTIFALNQSKQYKLLLETAEKRDRDFVEMERETFKTDHVEIGRTVFNTWKLPEQLKEIISEHEFDAARIGEMSDLVRLSALGSLVARELIGIPLFERDLSRKDALVAHYQAEDLLAKEFGEGRYALIQDHPFYKQVVSG